MRQRLSANTDSDRRVEQRHAAADARGAGNRLIPVPAVGRPRAVRRTAARSRVGDGVSSNGRCRARGRGNGPSRAFGCTDRYPRPDGPSVFDAECRRKSTLCRSAISEAGDWCVRFLCFLAGEGGRGPGEWARGRAARRPSPRPRSHERRGARRVDLPARPSGHGLRAEVRCCSVVCQGKRRLRRAACRPP